ncbi:hypothetical protein JW992_16665 [candidate division KSB1 bacterium]|nr:hypothetical protein [candidate division KSB1 bacterium]
MSQNPQLKQMFRLRTSEVDASGIIKPKTVADFFQEIAGNHADRLGLGSDRLRDENLFWVLSLLKFTFHDYPRLRSQIVVTTWPTGFNRYYANRAFSVRDEGGAIVVEGQSRWLVVDLVSRRPCHIPEWMHKQLAVTLQNIPVTPKEVFPEPQIEKTFEVRYSDLDFNQHVNNINYIEWILESMPMDVLLERKIASMEITYRAEAQMHDQVLCQTALKNNEGLTFLHRCVEKKTKRELVRAWTQWRS